MEESKKKVKKKFRNTFWYRLLTTILILAVFGGIGAGAAYAKFYSNPDKTIEKYMKDYINQNLKSQIIDYKIHKDSENGKQVNYTVTYYLFDEKHPDDEKGIEKKLSLVLEKTSKWYEPVAQWKVAGGNK